MSKNKYLNMCFFIAGAGFILCTLNDVNAMSVKDIGIPVDVQGELSFLSKPDYPESTAYSIVNLNIRQYPSNDSKIIGRYNKGDKVSIVKKVDKEWIKTDKGFVWGGYLSNTYKTDLNISACSDEASKYAGRVYDVINSFDDKYKHLLSKYNIFVSEDVSVDFKWDDKDNNDHLVGITRLAHSNKITARDMYIQGNYNKEKLKDIIYHELGHALDFENYENMLSESDVVKKSDTSEKDAVIDRFNLKKESVAERKEYFAEAFRISFKDPEGLQECAPCIFDYITKIKEDIGN